MRGFDSCYPCILKLRKKSSLFSKLARIEKNRRLFTRFNKTNKFYFNRNLSKFFFNKFNFKSEKNKKNFFFTKNLVFIKKNNFKTPYSFFKAQSTNNFKKNKVLPLLLFIKFFKFKFKKFNKNLNFFLFFKFFFIKNSKNLNFFLFFKFFFINFKLINHFSILFFSQNSFKNFSNLYYYYLNSFNNLFFRNFFFNNYMFNDLNFLKSKKFFFFSKKKKNFSYLFYTSFLKKKKKIFTFKKREMSFYFKTYPLIFSVIKHFYFKNNIFFYKISPLRYFYDNFTKITNDSFFYNKYTLMVFSKNILSMKQKFTNSLSFLNISNLNAFDKSVEAFKNGFFKQNINFFKNIHTNKKFSKNPTKKKKFKMINFKKIRFFFFYKKLTKILLKKLFFLTKKKKIKNKFFFYDNAPKLNFSLDNISSRLKIKKKKFKINLIKKNNFFFNKKSNFFCKTFDTFFLTFKNNYFENYLHLFFTPLFFKNLLYTKNFLFDIPNAFSNFQNNFIFFLEKNYFYSKNNNIVFSNNIFPIASSFNFSFKKYLLRTFNFKMYSFATIPFHYWTILKFIEFCSGKKVYIRLNSFLYSVLDEKEQFRCLIWSTKLRNFRKILGPKLFIRESLEIMYTCFKLKDPYILSNWILGMLNKISFWKFKLFFRYMQYVLRYFFWTVFKDLKMKGLKFQLKGKISVAGNARTRTVLHKIGFTSHATFNNKILYNLNLIKTFTGVIGFKTWLVF